MAEKYQFWFIVGSQHLYEPEVLREVAAHARIMTEGFNADQNISDFRTERQTFAWRYHMESIEYGNRQDIAGRYPVEQQDIVLVSC